MAARNVIEYVKAGISPFGIWFSALDAQAAAKVTVALYRLEQGNISNVKSVGQGVSEYKIDFGPGYRVYFGQEVTGHPARRRLQENAAKGHSDRLRIVGGVQAGESKK